MHVLSLRSNQCDQTFSSASSCDVMSQWSCDNE